MFYERAGGRERASGGCGARVRSAIGRRTVTTIALTARRLADPAEPPLKPNQPNQRRTVPRMTCETEWGLYASRSVPYPLRLPR